MELSLTKITFALISDICTLPAVVGLCEAKIPSYFYNFEARHCEYFEYGGCGGNANSFESERECRATCSGVYNSSSCNYGQVIFSTWQFPLTSGCLKSCGPILLNQHVTFPRDQRNTCPQVELRNVFLGPTTCLH